MLFRSAGAADPFTWTLRLVGLAATLAVTVLVTRVARRALATPSGSEPAKHNVGATGTSVARELAAERGDLG